MCGQFGNCSSCCQSHCNKARQQPTRHQWQADLSSKGLSKSFADKNGNGEISISFTDTSSSANTSASEMVEVTANRSDLSMTNTTEDLPMSSIHVAFALSGLSPHTDYVI